MGDEWGASITEAQFGSIVRELTARGAGEALAQGAALVRGKSVRMTAMSPKGHVFGTVDDGGVRYIVEFAPGGLERSRCTCWRSPYCGHVMALFLVVAGSNGFHLERISKMQPPSSSAADGKMGWPARAATLVAGAMPSVGEAQLSHYKRFREAAEKACSTHVPADLQPLAMIHAAAVFLSAAEHRRRSAHSMYAWGMTSAFHEVASECLSLIVQSAQSTDRQRAKEADDGEIRRALMEELRDGAFADKQDGAKRPLVDWMSIYRLAWTQALSVVDWVLEEREWLRSERRRKPAAGGAASSHAGRLWEGELHLSFVLRDIDMGAALLEDTIAGRWPRILSPYMHAFLQQDDDRLRLWLMRLGDMAAVLRPNEEPERLQVQAWLAELWAAWAEADAKDGLRAREALERATSLLPGSADAYAALLLRCEEYERWADLQLALGSPPEYMNREAIKLVAKRRPELLLPIYHASIERQVACRQSFAYRQAVKELAALAKLYKRLKRQAEWERFLELFLKKYSRLKSLKSEIARRLPA